MYRSGHEEFVGGDEDPTPEEGLAISGTIFLSVFIYLVRMTEVTTLALRPPLTYRRASLSSAAAKACSMCERTDEAPLPYKL